MGVANAPKVGPCDLRFTYLGRPATCLMTVYQRDDEPKLLCVLAPTDDLPLFHAFGQAATVAAIILEHNHNIRARRINFALKRGQRLEICDFKSDAYGGTEFIATSWHEGSVNIADQRNWK